MATQSEASAFKGWMTRFIVTNFEIYIDHLNNHAEFTAQKYFSKSYSANNLAKTGIQDEKVLFGS
jgi:hypothetical protein